MNKTLLVARREFVEFMRTKTFWIGILAFPIIWVLFIGGAMLLNKTKDERTYSILDYSVRNGQEEWLSGEIRGRSLQRLQRVRMGVPNQLDGEPFTAAQIREAMQEFREEQRSESFRELIDIFLGFPDEDLEAFNGGTGGAFAVILKHRGEIEAWYAKQDPDSLVGELTVLDKERYVEVSIEELGEEAEEALREKINRDELFAYFVIGEDPVASTEGSRYVSNNVTDDELRDWFTGLATEVVREERIGALGLSDSEAQSIRTPFTFLGRKVSEEGEEEDVSAADEASQFAPVIFVYLLWIAVFTAAQMLLTNTVEEKSNRIIEVLLSSVSPMQLMAGKIWGIAATGLTIVGSWVVFALIGIKLLPIFVPDFNIPLAPIIANPLYLASFIGYFVAGYLMYAALLVAIGSVCNSLKEAQSLMQPVIIFLIIPLIAMIPVMNDPNGTVARVLTYVPVWTPFLMMNRAAGPPPAWEYVATLVLLVVTIVVAFWGAGKIFRIGVLMTGKPPKIREILGWLRAPVGAVAVRKEDQ